MQGRTRVDFPHDRPHERACIRRYYSIHWVYTWWLFVEKIPVIVSWILPKLQIMLRFWSLVNWVLLDSTKSLNLENNLWHFRSIVFFPLWRRYVDLLSRKIYATTLFVIILCFSDYFSFRNDLTLYMHEFTYKIASTAPNWIILFFVDSFISRVRLSQRNISERIVWKKSFKFIINMFIYGSCSFRQSDRS